MTITSQTSKSGPYSGNDSITTFAYTFLATDEEHLIVTLLDADGVTETVQTLGAAEDYTVTGVGTVSGGTVEMAVPPATGEQLLITRSVTKTQEINLQNRAALVPEIIEDSFDKLTQIVQDLQGLSDRSVKIGPFDDLGDVDTLYDDILAAQTGAETAQTAAETSAAEAAASAASILSGALIDRGSNINGVWVRFADGTQICTGSFTASSIVANGSGTWSDPYSTDGVDITHAAAFISAPVLTGQAVFTSGIYNRQPSLFRVATVKVAIATQLRVFRMSDAANADTPLINYISVGRWV